MTLEYQGRFPLGVLTQTDEWGDDLLVQLNDQNESLLHNLLKMNDSSADAASYDDANVQQDIARLESKINMLLELVGELVSQNVERPPACSVRFGVSHIVWQMNGAALPVDARVIITLYLDPHHPRPLELACRMGAEEVIDGCSWQRAEFIGLSDTSRELLEKLIFRHHRRTVAKRRAQR